MWLQLQRASPRWHRNTNLRLLPGSGRGCRAKGVPASSPNTRAGASRPFAPSSDWRRSAPPGAAAARSPSPRVRPYQLHQEGGDGSAGPAEGPGEAEQPRAQRRLEQDEDGAGGGEPGRGGPGGAPRRRQQGPGLGRRPFHRGAPSGLWPGGRGGERGPSAGPRGRAGRAGAARTLRPPGCGEGSRAGGGRGNPGQELTHRQPVLPTAPAAPPALRALLQSTAAPGAGQRQEGGGLPLSLSPELSPQGWVG